MSAPIEAFTTRYGTTIPARVIRDIIRDIVEGVDYQRTITDHLREFIPEHDDDLEEASEVYNHAEALAFDLSTL